MEKVFLTFSTETPVEFSDDSFSTITGIIPYGTTGQKKMGVIPRLFSGCFSDSLKTNPDIFALFNHDWDRPLARTSTGSLRLVDTEQGMRVSLTPAKTSWGIDAIESIKAGLMDGFSFGGFIVGEKFSKETGIQDILNFELWEVSPVFTPVFQEGARIETNSGSKEPPEDDDDDVVIMSEPKTDMWTLKAIQKQAEIKRQSDT